MIHLFPPYHNGNERSPWDLTQPPRWYHGL